MITKTIEELKTQYNVLAVIDLDQTHSMQYADMQTWLKQQCLANHKESYAPTDKIVFTYTHDRYVKNDSIGVLIRNLQITLLETDISSAFVTVVSTNPNLGNELKIAQSMGKDDYVIDYVVVDGPWTSEKLTRYPGSLKDTYNYDSLNPLKISMNELSQREKSLLTESKTFCIYPWIHLNANPDGKAYPCCMTEHNQTLGNCKSSSLEEIWNNDKMKSLRLDMLNEKSVEGCRRCYEQEKSGFFSGRLSANKHHGHHISKVLETNKDGSLDRFEMVYWDIRFSNLCNLRCRSCGHIYSSQWHQDQSKLAGPEWAKINPVLNYAGRTETDMWEQLEPHLDYVEQIYFAGGEPLLMEEHYHILEELLKRGRTDVRLIYNTNFTHIKLKDKYVFDYWRQFESISVGASLDAMGAVGEYVRKGTDWLKVESNRSKMLEICPRVDFYISATLSILNAKHLPKFHRDWVEKGLIAAKDFNVNILLDPNHYRIDIATKEYKEELSTLYLNHILWLRNQVPLNRATNGFESAIAFMNATDNSGLIPKFWEKTNQLDSIRNESLLDVIPELSVLK
jgi:radical SAM protein with 4Fe4S-binding SPASM domain